MDDSLCGKKVMVAVGTTAEALSQDQSDKCTAAGQQAIDINRNNHADVSIQQVQNGQVDAYLDTAETLGYYATKTGAQIQLAGRPFGTIKIGAATLKGEHRPAGRDPAGVAIAGERRFLRQDPRPVGPDGSVDREVT